MAQITVPEELDTLSDEELASLADDIRAAAEELGPDAKNDDQVLATVEALVAQFDRVNEEVASREARKVEREQRTAAALTKFQGEADSDADADADADEDGDEDKAVDAEDETLPVAAQVANADEASASEAPAEATVADAPSTDTQAEAPAEATIATSEDAVSDTLSTSTAVGSLDADRPDALAPRVEEATSTGAPLLSSNAVPGFREGQELGYSALAHAIVDKRLGFNKVSAGTHDRIVLASAQIDAPHKLSMDQEANFDTLESIRSEWAASRNAATSLVAAGGVCAPLEPSYEFFRLAEEINPVEGSLPLAEAPRGGIRFITPTDYRDAAGGVRITTEAEDAAGYGDGPGQVDPKPCVRVVCPPVEECRVDAVSQCVTFGNLNYRVFPEQVESFLKDLAVIFTQVKEVFYLDAIDAASTAVTFTPAYSAVRGITYTLLAAAANYRRRHHMPAESTLTLHLPSWVVEFLKVDLINDHSMGLGFIGAGQGDVAAVFASMNLDVNFYYDSATGAGQAFAGAQGAGALNEFPSTVVAYLYAPGTFVRLNAGTLDLGVVRDSILNGTNDLQLFSEEWIQVCQVGLESLRLEISLCPDGTAPEPVAPLSCAAISA